MYSAPSDGCRAAATPERKAVPEMPSCEDEYDCDVKLDVRPDEAAPGLETSTAATVSSDHATTYERPAASRAVMPFGEATPPLAISSE